MGQNKEKPIYSITLKSEEDDEVTVIDRSQETKAKKTSKLFLTQILKLFPPPHP